MKRTLMVSSFAIAFATLLGASSVTAAPSADADRAALTRAVIQKWSAHVEKAYPIGADAWAVEMAPAFAEASLEELRAAASAKNFDSMNSLLLGRDDAGTQAIGDLATDLVYVPVTPCRLFDTRLSGGALAANTVRGFDVTAVSDYSFQGGAATDCGVGLAGSFAAAVINFTVVAPSAAGFITAYPVGGVQPNASTLNYAAGNVVGNSAIVKLDQGAAANEVNVYSFAGTHLVGDIVGYFAAPQATGLQCTETFVSGTVAANGVFDTQIPSCPAGYTITGAGCRTPGFNDVTWAINGLYRNAPGVMLGFCSGTNNTAGVVPYEGTAQCCRTPGQ